MRRIEEVGLQVVLDRGCLKGRGVMEAAEGVIAGGARCIQLRDKLSPDREILTTAKRLGDLTRSRGVILIINDRVDIALASNADGVHLGQDDMPYREARRLLGDRKIIGISAHSIEEAKGAEEAGSDYIGFGPIFRTTTKPDLIPLGVEMVGEVLRSIAIPTFFIGGIDTSNVDGLISRGGKSVAIASAILNKGDISLTTKAFMKAVESRRLEPVASSTGNSL